MRRYLIGGLLGLCQLTAAAASDVTVAVVGPMSGPLAEFGAQIRAGVEFAVADINASGGVNGTPIKVRIEDDGCDPAKAVTTAARLAAEEIAVVIGHFCSRASIPAAKVYASAGIIQITPASTHPRLTTERIGNSLFRLSGRDDQQAQLAATYLVKTSAYRNIAIAHDQSGFGKWLASETQQAIRAVGKDAISFGVLDADLTPLVARMKVAGTDAVYYAGRYEDAVRLIRAFRKHGMGTRLVGSDALATQAFWQSAGIAAKGTVMTHLWDPQTGPAAKAVVARMRSRRIEADGYVLYAHAAIEVWLQAVSAAGSLRTSDIVKALHASAFSTVLGRFKFDERGDPDRSFFRTYQWAAGRYELLD